MIALVFILSLLSLPLVSMDPYILHILIIATIFAIYAASWDLLAGFAGQLSLGHALFFGVAAYTAALLNKHFGLPPLITIPCGGLAAVMIGLIAGLPALRLRGFYLALVTLSFPIILTGLIYLFPKFTGGELGLYNIDPLSGSRVLDYYIVLVVMLVSVFTMYKLTDAESKHVRTGVIFHAIREDEIAARVSGIYTSRYKLLAFAVSGIFAGIAGGLYAHFIRVSGPSTLELLFSFYPILWTVFGGIATIYGPVVGVYILYPLLEILGFHPWGEATRFIIFSLILMITLFFMPQGVSTWIRDKIEIRCPRCKLINMSTRYSCRACRASLRPEKE
ncbi:MAG: branched-chain amino acid ABC transporter permease [Deltaproteobacteria bacterium]|nr:branched-chain amino acid ABC transporter permease [Deltaproteobacteria bacterium]